MPFYRQGPVVIRFIAAFVASLLVAKALLGKNGPAILTNSRPFRKFSGEMAFVQIGYQGDTFGEYHSKETDHVTAKTNLIEATQFADVCNPDALFEVKSIQQFNVSIAETTTNQHQSPCPRVIASSVSGLPLTGLLSFPGSGNTWVRHILQELTGLPTGSIYDDKILRSNGFPSEGEVENVLVVKSHVMSRRQPKFIPVKKFDRIIIIVRNVYHSFLAEYKRNRLTGSHTADGYLNTSHPTWSAFMEKAGYRWKTFMLDAFDFDGPMLVVFYEDLKSQLLLEIIRLADFLQSEKLKEFSFCCVVKEREGNFHRSSNLQQAEDIFNESQKASVNRQIRYVVKKLMGKHKKVAERLASFIMP